ncbi:MAG: Hsp20/alpha crystallin family protein [Desulforhabdus sp.]|jgi:HSP20 family protein|nr:Hsp20/alpha crystallin family protein [Desulforhabdus sp.]
MADKDLQVQEKQELQTKSESTRNVPMFVPAVDIYESQNELTLLADMPGVPIEGVDIDLREDQLTIRGKGAAEEQNGTILLREYAVGDYYRQFTVSNAIDREKIVASMKDGVLKVVLPKAEAAKPRKIEVKTS